MNSLPLNEIAAMCGGQPPEHSGQKTVRRITKDTRTLVPGDLYLALRGENFDGNAFVNQAAAKGAAAAILDDPGAPRPPELPVILVENGLKALHRLAEAWRDRLALKVIGITGSNGKTTTKEFTSAVLSTRYRTVKTEGNLNNHVGVPLSILAAEVADGAAVWEIGMNHAGEIAPLAALVRPDVGIITNIGVAHIEFLGSREAIAKEKRALLESLRPGGVAVIPDSDEFSDYLAAGTVARVIRVGGPHSEIRAEDVHVTTEGTSFRILAGGEQVSARLPVPGLHMVSNALLAVGAGMACGLSLEECAEGLEQSPIIGGRLAKKVIRGVIFLDDTYNANPDSMVAALEVLQSLKCDGKRIAVLGCMGELGRHAEEGYCRVGSHAGADLLITVGPETLPMATAAKGHFPEVRSFDSTEEASEFLRQVAEENDIVLVKGSRAARMETVIHSF
ncbi:MAG: UDP-N-acetylmuramoyl-tripeptide--D-alanyl-D-alanine ligase [Terrimicrobiaceae bacterium]